MQSLEQRPKRRRSDVEYEIQSACVYWCEKQAGLWPELETFYAIINQGNRGDFGHIRATKEGLKKGMPDTCLPIARRGWNQLYIEFKEPGEKPRPKQHEKMILLQNWGNLCYCVDNHYDFIELMTWYLGYDEGTISFSQDDKFMFTRAVGPSYGEVV